MASALAKFVAKYRVCLRSLRFETLEKEDAYVRTREQSLRKVVLSTTVTGFLLLAFGAVDDPIWQAAASDMTFRYKALRYTAIGFTALVLATHFLAAYRNWLGAHSLETFAAFELGLVAASLPFVSPPHLSRLLGTSEAELLGKSFPNADTIFLLYIDLLVTAAHITPIRWFKLVPLAALTIVEFGWVVLHLSEFEPPLVATSGFAALVLFSSVGKRTVELWERENFTMVLAEKEKRFVAEHMMDQGQHAPAVHGNQDHVDADQASARDGSCHPESLTSTTLASKVFQLDRDPLPSSLAQLLQIGEQEQWLLPSSALRLLPNSLLGSGGFGMVVQGDYNGSEVAVKAPRRSALDRTTDFRLLCNELRLLRRLRHPNIVACFGACLDAEDVDMALVLEHLRGETLLTYVRKRAPTSDVRLQLLRDVSAAFVYLHGRTPAIVHGDLKADNVFVEYAWGRMGSCRGKLLDFGLSLSRTKHARAAGGTLRWTAPERFREHAKTPERSTDIYAVGCLIYFVVTGTLPYFGVSDQEMRALLACQLPPFTWPQAPLVASHRPLAESCCDRDPQQRPAIRDVLCSLLRSKPSAREKVLREALEEARRALTERDLQRTFGPPFNSLKRSMSQELSRSTEPSSPE